MHQQHIMHLSAKSQMAILLIILAALAFATFTPNGFMNFLSGLRAGEVSALALLMAILATGLILLHKLGLNIAYKEEIQAAQEGRV
jgi:hypothetical protein